MKFDDEYWIPHWGTSIQTANPGKRSKIKTAVNSVDEGNLLQVNWEWNAAQGKAQTYKML